MSLLFKFMFWNLCYWNVSIDTESHNLIDLKCIYFKLNVVVLYIHFNMQVNALKCVFLMHNKIQTWLKVKHLILRHQKVMVFYFINIILFKVLKYTTYISFLQWYLCNPRFVNILLNSYTQKTLCNFNTKKNQ